MGIPTFVVFVFIDAVAFFIFVVCFSTLRICVRETVNMEISLEMTVLFFGGIFSAMVGLVILTTLIKMIVKGQMPYLYRGKSIVE